MKKLFNLNFLFLLFLFFKIDYVSSNDISNNQRYKLYCFYTPQFKDMYTDWFLPSIKDDFEIITEVHPQECPTGEFRSKGYDKSMLRKLKMIESAILSHMENNIFFYSDIDIIFFKPVVSECLKWIENCDFVAQVGWPKKLICAGFMVFRGNDRTLKFIRNAIKLLESGAYAEDQEAMRKILETDQSLKWRLLPSEQFPNGKRIMKNYDRLYSRDEELVLPNKMLMFHANCCRGLDSKYDFMNQVYNLYYEAEK